MKIAVKLDAPNDVNGNPQRGWMVYEVKSGDSFNAEADFVKFVDEEYLGNEALHVAFPGEFVMDLFATIPTSKSFYRAMLKRDKPEYPKMNPAFEQFKANKAAEADLKKFDEEKP